jgi:rhodanese-related sulfurtransferase
MTPALDWRASWVEFLKNLPDDSYTIPVDELASMVSNGTAPFLLDVRDPSEISQYGHIPGAVNIPYKTVLQNLDKLPSMDKPIIVYSSIGHRGTIILCALRLLGYTDVRELDGGMYIWLSSKYAPDNTTPAAPVSQSKTNVDQTKVKDLQALIDTGTFGLTPNELQTAIDGTSKPIVLDVREVSEITATGAIPNSVHVDLRTLFDHTDVLPADKATFIVVVDTTGHNGTIATMALRMNGYKNVRSLFGGMNEWIEHKHTIVK